MRVQHPGYAGLKLALPFQRDPETGKLESVVLDAQGIGEVPERDGLWLIATPGWREAPDLIALSPTTPVPSATVSAASAGTRRMVGEMLAHPDPAYAARYARSHGASAREDGRLADADLLDETAVALEAKAPSVPDPSVAQGLDVPLEELSDGDHVPGLGAEIDALATKKDALAFGELHGFTGLTDGMLLRDMRDALKIALLGPAADPATLTPAAGDKTE